MAKLSRKNKNGKSVDKIKKMSYYNIKYKPMSERSSF